MSPKTYRKKPVEIQAMRCDETTTPDEVAAWCGGRVVPVEEMGGPVCVEIATLEGTMIAHPGDYVIRGVQGEFYPCRSDVFEVTYEAVDQ